MMLRFSKYLKLSVSILIVCFSLSCEKPAGPGGNATIKGRVYSYDFDNTQRYLVSKGYSSGERVYIIYGDRTAVGKDVRTSIDGSFEFRFLNKGKYRVFVNSLDTSIKVKGNDTELPVIQEIEITKNRQVIELPDFVINK